MKGNYGKRFLSLLLSAIMVLGMLPVGAFATDEGMAYHIGPCEHHVCGVDCGYVEGQSCECTEEDADGAILHVEDCGYVAAQSCMYMCTICGEAAVAAVNEEQKPEIPEGIAKIEELPLEDGMYDGVMLTTALNFSFNEDVIAAMGEEAALELYEAYKDDYVDFELMFDKDVTLGNPQKSESYLAGQYAAWSDQWVLVPGVVTPEDVSKNSVTIEPVTLKANQPLRLMDYAATTTGISGLRQTLKDIYGTVQTFNCGIANPSEKWVLKIGFLKVQNW